MTTKTVTPDVVWRAALRAVPKEARPVIRQYRAEVAYRDRVIRVVDQAPPLTDQQRARIRVLFMGSAPYEVRKG